MDRRTFIGAAAVSTGLFGLSPAARADQDDAWALLPTEPFRGKQDDVVFLDGAQVGWFGNGLGRLYKTTDGGRSWVSQMDRPGLFVRALGFIDADRGFLGNVGPGYFPNVTDPIPLYRTLDGGRGWSPVTITGPALVGVCAIHVQSVPYINAGVLAHREVIRAAGRVGGPAILATSRDGGETWASADLSALTAMILDVVFVDERVGFIAGASDASVQNAHALILRTDDGGDTWSVVHRGERPWELIWKLGFPTADVGYGTVQSYNPDPAVTQRVFAKTTDGGRTWSELPLVDDARVRTFGVGFIDDRIGWMGAAPGGLATRDGGRTWTPAGFGPAVNKIRVVPTDGGVSVFAIGSQLHRLDIPRTAPV